MAIQAVRGGRGDRPCRRRPIRPSHNRRSALQRHPPGTELSYESAVEVLVFNRLDRPHLPRGSKLRWRGSTWTVDQVAKRDDHTLAPA